MLYSNLLPLCTYLPTNGNQKPISEVAAPKGESRRLFMVGGISIYGHLISHYPQGHPKAGQPVLIANGERMANV